MILPCTSIPLNFKVRPLREDKYVLWKSRKIMNSWRAKQKTYTRLCFQFNEDEYLSKLHRIYVMKEILNLLHSPYHIKIKHLILWRRNRNEIIEVVLCPMHAWKKSPHFHIRQERNQTSKLKACTYQGKVGLIVSVNWFWDA